MASTVSGRRRSGFPAAAGRVEAVVWPRLTQVLVAIRFSRVGPCIRRGWAGPAEAGVGTPEPGGRDLVVCRRGLRAAGLGRCGAGALACDRKPRGVLQARVSWGAAATDPALLRPSWGEERAGPSAGGLEEGGEEVRTSTAGARSRPGCGALQAWEALCDLGASGPRQPESRCSLRHEAWAGEGPLPLPKPPRMEG